jgi:ribonucleases P/MRP protein subunit RPP40
VIEYMESQNSMSREQHGFTVGRSCLTNLLESMEDWTQALDEGYGIDVVFLDYQKAFDTVPHRRLVRKLNGYGIRGKVLAWIENFLSNRSMRVVLGENATDWVKVLSGVPQGSVLGPLLFLLYVNEIPDTVKSTIKMFADDTKIWRVLRKNEDPEILQEDLHRLEKWSEEWLLRFNAAKCKVMHIGGLSGAKYTLQDGTIRRDLAHCISEKDLGLYVRNDLKWSEQCSKAASKASSVLGMIKRAFRTVDRDGFKILYNTYVRPQLEYCAQVWSPHYKKDVECLEKIQRRATCLVRGFQKMKYEQRLKELELMTLQQRRKRGDLIETYKIMSGLERVEASKFFTRAGTVHLRGNSLKMYKKQARIDVRRCFFSMRVVEEWNKLPEVVVKAENIEMFKRRLDSWMFGYGH